MSRIRGKQIETQTITNENIYIGLPPLLGTDAISLEYFNGILSGITSSGSTTIGAPRNGDWDTEGGYFQGVWENTTPTGFAFDDVSLVIAKLLPTVPPNLSTKTLVISGLYTALTQGTGVSRSNVTDDTTPTATLSPSVSPFGVSFSDGATGVLSATTDGVASGTLVLYSGFTGSDLNLTVLTNSDPYSGQTGKAGFYYSLTAQVLTATPISPSNTFHYYGLTHSKTGTANSGLGFYVDNPGVTTVSSPSYTISGTIRYVSGVKSLNAGQTVSVDYTINNAVGYYYTPNSIGVVSSTYASTANSPQPYTIPNNLDPVSFTGQTITISTNKYGPEFTFNIVGYNSKNVAGTVSAITTNTYIDTVSDETIRKTSSTGQYPTTGYGSTYDSSKNIKTDVGYTEELQMVNGRFIYPSANFSTYSSPTDGSPDYSSGMGSSDRWVTFDLGSITNKSTIEVTFNSALNFSGTITTGIKIYAKAEGATGWIDCNASYPGTGSPVNDGDPAMVFADSTATKKRFTFGSTPRSGQLYLRVGLPTGSNKSWTTITTNVIN